MKSVNVPLSHLAPSRRNPRKVRPSQQSHESLVAMIRTLGLLQPLVVRPVEDDGGHFEVIAGHRRLKALREIHRNDGDVKIPCVLCDLDDVATADAVSLSENFAREAMHPMDEADAFNKLAKNHGKEVESIATEFGVTERYVHQRMRLAELAGVVKTAFREGEIDIATAEVFASVPEPKQVEVWNEMNGHPRHAEHVRNVIANDWIDASHAIFDLSTLPPSAVSRDLFSEKVLVGRSVFMAAQAAALDKEKTAMLEAGWSNVVAGAISDVSAPVGMYAPEREFDPETTARLEKIVARQQKLEAKAAEIKEVDETAAAALQKKFEALEAEEQEIIEHAPAFVSEETKAVATAFVILCPDGQIRREYRVPRHRMRQSTNGHSSEGSDSGVGKPPAPPTSDDLNERQLAVTFTHQALAVREVLLKNAPARKRILALILHHAVRSEALSIRHEPNATTVCANTEKFTSPVLDRLREKRAKLDPFADQHFVEDRPGYKRLGELSALKLEALTDLLIVDCVGAHLQHRTELVHLLASELKVNIRDHWRPDADWLSSYQKIQLAHLITDLKGGPVHAPAPDRKKSELVEMLAKLFTDAAEGKLEDKALVDRVNQWLPSNFRESDSRETATI